MRSSHPNATTMAWMGQPWLSQVRTSGYHVCSRRHPLAGRVLGGREGLATTRTAIALRCLAMLPNVPLAPLPSGKALRVVAALGVRVHRRLPFETLDHNRRFGFASHFRRCMADPLSCQPQYAQLRSEMLTLYILKCCP